AGVSSIADRLLIAPPAVVRRVLHAAVQRRPRSAVHPGHPLPADPGFALGLDPSLPRDALVRAPAQGLLLSASARAHRRGQGGRGRRVAHLLPDRGPAVASGAGDRGPALRAHLLERLVPRTALHQQPDASTAAVYPL